MRLARPCPPARAPRPRRRALLLPLVAAAATVLTAGGLVAGCARPAPDDGVVVVRPAGSLSLSKATYYDKTLAGIVGEVGGFLSGYEFSTAGASPHPDSWFDPANGPYAGNVAHADPGGIDSYKRLLGTGRVRGQDNYFMDFFNQLVIKEHGLFPSDADLRAEYLAHGINDYGGSQIADELMSSTGMGPFQTGEHEFNHLAWCCEPYIETDTLGFIAPGMPGTARDLAGRFATVSGTFDTTTWSQFLATLMSMAYTTDDARVALREAASTLPRDSWPYRVYQDAVALHAARPGDWRWAQAQLVGDRRWIYGSDEDRVLADINNGTVTLAILYGDNDYLKTLRIAAIGGNEGVDNATPIGGLMGVVKGMAGTPQAFLDKVYDGGNGVFVNDTSGTIRTYIRHDYPAEQKFTDLAKLYQGNAETAITAGGGTVSGDSYAIATQTPQVPVTVDAPNGDFETGTLDGWTLSSGDHGKAESQLDVVNGTHTTLAYSGNWKGTIWTDAATPDVSLTRTVTGLTTGATYRARAFVASKSGARAAFTADPGSGQLQASAASTEDMTSGYTNPDGRMFARRDLVFTATSSSVTLGLRLGSSSSAWANLDDVTLEQVTAPARTRYEAESATLSGGASAVAVSSASGGTAVGGLGADGASVAFTVQAPAAGEYRLAVRYASDAGTTNYRLEGHTFTLPARLALKVGGTDAGNVYFPRTGTTTTFTQDEVAIPVSLAQGATTITLTGSAAAGNLTLDSADLTTATRPVYTDAGASTLPDATRPPTPVVPAFAGQAANLVRNGGFEAGGGSLAGWDVWPGNAGTDTDAAFAESTGHSGLYRLTLYKATAYEVYPNQTITGLANGTYTLTAWATGGGGQNAAYLDAKQYGRPDRHADLPQSGWPTWTQVTLRDINITNGQLTIGVYTKATAGQWLSIDDVTLTPQT